MAWAALVAAAGALAAEPQCPVSVAACHYSFGSRRFGDVAAAVRAAGDRPIHRTTLAQLEPAREAACSVGDWRRYDACYTSACNLAVDVTAPEAAVQRICVEDSAFTPFNPAAHLDLYHSLNGVQTDVVLVGASSAMPFLRSGCAAGAYQGQNFTGRLALLQRGECDDLHKVTLAGAAGAAGVIVVNNDTSNDMDTQLYPIRGAASGAAPSIPAVAMPQQHGSVLLRAAQSGEALRGALTMRCHDHDAPVHDATAPSDAAGCAVPEVLSALCGGVVCGACPWEIPLPEDAAQNASTPRVCMWGNNLLPRAARTLLPASGEGVVALADGEGVLVGALPLGGCAQSDFTGLAGKVAFVPEPSACTPHELLWQATAAQVRAVVIYPAARDAPPVLIAGWSGGGSVPAHAISGPDYARVAAWAGGAPGAGQRTFLPGVTLEHGVPGSRRPSSPPPASPPPPPAPHGASSVEFSGTMMAGLVLSVVCLVAVAGVLAMQAKAAGALVPAASPQAAKVPLGVIGGVLVLLLLLVTGVVAIGVASAGGQAAVDTAIAGGRGMVADAHAATQDRVEAFAGRLRQRTVDAVRQGVRSVLEEGEGAAAAAAVALLDYDGATWASFAAALPRYMSLAAEYWAEECFSEGGDGLAVPPDLLPTECSPRTRGGGSSSHAWLVNTFTERQFFASMEQVTDDRADAPRDPAATGPVGETNFGGYYGTYAVDYDPATASFTPGASNYFEAYNVSRMYGGGVGDPLAATRGAARRTMRWHFSAETVPLQDVDAPQPLSVFTPLYNRRGAWVGTVEARTGVAALTRLLRSATALTPELANMTLVVFERAAQTVVATTAWPAGRVRGQARLSTWRPLRGAYSVRDLPAVHVQAYANFLDGTGGWSGHSGVIEQWTHYRPRHLKVLRFEMRDGWIYDVTGDNHQAGMHGTSLCENRPSGMCVAQDWKSGREVVKFDGYTSLHIYRNLTIDAPAVARTRRVDPLEDGNATGGAGRSSEVLTDAWDSTVEEYRHTQPLENPDGTATACVTFTHTPAAGDSRTACLLRQPWMSTGMYSVSVAIKPDYAISDAPYGAEGESTDTATTTTTSTTDPYAYPDPAADVLGDYGPPGGDPRILEDVESGASLFRLFANGRLHIGVYRYICQLPPHPGGVPAGAWTTVTAVVSLAAGCQVYINGTLSQSGVMSGMWDPTDRGEPYRVGRYYHGLMDNLTVYNVSLTPSEVASIHATGDAVRDVPQKHWYSDVESLDETTAQRSGVEWSVLAMVPRDDILGTDADRLSAHAALLTALKGHHADADTRVTQGGLEAAWMMLAVALCCVIVFLLALGVFAEWFAVVAVAVVDAGEWRVRDDAEEVEEKTPSGKEVSVPQSEPAGREPPPVPPSSLITEVHVLLEALAFLRGSLGAYRAYLAPGVVCGLDQDGDAQATRQRHRAAAAAAPENDEDEEHNPGEDAPALQKAGTASNTQPFPPPVVLADLHQKRDRVLAGLRVGLTEKRFALYMLNLRRFLDAPAAELADRACDTQRRVLDAVSGAVFEHGAVLESWCGDRFVASVNASRSNADYPRAAIALALQVRTELWSIWTNGWHAAVVCGKGWVGNAGSAALRRYSFISPVYSLCTALLEYAQHKGIGILTTRQSVIRSRAPMDAGKGEAGEAFAFKCVGPVRSVKARRPLVVLYEVTGALRQSAAEEEWMHELDTVEKGHTVQWNLWVEALIHEQWDVARDHAAGAKQCGGPLYETFKTAQDTATPLLRPDVTNPWDPYAEADLSDGATDSDPEDEGAAGEGAGVDAPALPSAVVDNVTSPVSSRTDKTKDDVEDGEGAAGGGDVALLAASSASRESDDGDGVVTPVLGDSAANPLLRPLAKEEVV